MDRDKFIRPDMFGMFDYDKSKKIEVLLATMLYQLYVLHILIHSIIYRK